VSQVAHTSSKKCNSDENKKIKKKKKNTEKKNVEINDSEKLTEYNIFVRQHRMAARSDFVSDGTKKAMRLRPQPPQPL